MRRRSRRIRALKWVGTLVCVLVALTGAATIAWIEVGFNTGENYAVRARGGAVSFVWKVQNVPYIIPMTACEPHWWAWPPPKGWSSIRRSWSYDARWPQSCFQAGQRWITVPLWLPFIIAAIPTGLFWWLDRRRHPPGRCQRCGYDLTGNISGRCPECGESATAGHGGDE